MRTRGCCRLGVDVGGSKLLACALDHAGRVRAWTKQPSGRAVGPDELAARVAAIKSQFEEELELDIEAIGVGVPGLVDFARGVVRSSIMLDGWRDVALAARLERATGVPCAVDNDVNAAAIGELMARGPEPAMMLVSIGTGIGGALVLDGKLWRGVSGVAGEIGNLVVDPNGARCWCGRRGCLNTVASGSAIEHAAGLAPGTLAEAWRRGDPRAIEAALAGARWLAAALVDALHVFNPSLIVLGGGVAQLGARWLDEVRRGVREAGFAEAVEACRVEPALAGYQAGAIGAALLAAESFADERAPYTEGAAP